MTGQVGRTEDYSGISACKMFENQLIDALGLLQRHPVVPAQALIAPRAINVSLGVRHL